MKQDEHFMRLAFDQAKKGEFSTYPNPWVGAVIVKQGRVVAGGWHARAGRPHAELAALLRAGKQAKGATLYISLEPCNHWGKTPPCTRAILQAGIARVVAACPDPNEHAKGGMAWLKKRGIKVADWVLRQEAEELNRFFLFSAKHARPWVTIKAGMTLDGKAAIASGQSQWITSEAARQDARQLRGQCDGVLVGAGTVIADNPGLLPSADSKFLPWRFVLDPKARVKGTEKVFRDEAAGRTVWLAGAKASREKQGRIRRLGCRVEVFKTSDLGKMIPAALNFMGKMPLRRLLVEGGPDTLGAFLRLGLAQEAVLYLAPKLMGGQDSRSVFGGLGPKSLKQMNLLKSARVEKMGEDFKVRGFLAN